MDETKSRSRVEDLLQRVDGYDKQQWRKQISLPKTAAMCNGIGWHTIEKNPWWSRAAIQSQNLLRKPLLWRMSNMYSQRTESKAFRMSSLKRRERVLFLWSGRARFLTYIKLSWILLFLMKALWELETVAFMCGESLTASILAMAWIRLIGLKSMKISREQIRKANRKPATRRIRGEYYSNPLHPRSSKAKFCLLFYPRLASLGQQDYRKPTRYALFKSPKL